MYKELSIAKHIREQRLRRLEYMEGMEKKRMPKFTMSSRPIGRRKWWFGRTQEKRIKVSSWKKKTSNWKNREK